MGLSDQGQSKLGPEQAGVGMRRPEQEGDKKEEKNPRKNYRE